MGTIEKRKTLVGRIIRKGKTLVGRGVDKLLLWFAPIYHKEAHEFSFWKSHQEERHGTLSNSHYAYFYTDFFNVPLDFYWGKKLLDIGCGPCGSLEWAEGAEERIGLDPLVPKYRELGIDRHKMKYINARSESIPFPDGYFDCVFSFNSLDHVANADQTISEIKRVLKPGGIFLLIVEVNHPATATEPITFDWNVPSLFEDQFTLRDLRKYETGTSIYGQLSQNTRYDDANLLLRPGLAAASFVKR